MGQWPTWQSVIRLKDNRTDGLATLALLAVGIISVIPLLVEPFPREQASSWATRLLEYLSKGTIVLVLGSAITIQANIKGSHKLTLGLVTLAALMATVHYVFVDREPGAAAWQAELYHDILNHTRSPDDGQYRAPHQFRPLPYGFVRSLELVTGDRSFATFVYRWFFCYWFLWAAYYFARYYHTPLRAGLTLVPLLLLYPFSIAYYLGQLTDPMSHALFAISLLCLVQGRLPLLALSLALGIMAKETVVIVVPAYFFYAYWKRLPFWPTVLQTVGLGAVCIAAFLAMRLPLEGWSFNNQSMNGNEQSMVISNLLTPEMANRLGLPEPRYVSTVPMAQNYLQPLLFIGSFVPLIVVNWRHIDGGLKWLFFVLTPLLLFSSLYYSWLYESRNYMPLVPLLATMALPQRVKS
jgi:hypothetical protein